MNLGRFFQRLALYRASRRVPLWALVALSVGFYLLASIGESHAHTIPSAEVVCTDNTNVCDPGQAHAECIAIANHFISHNSAYNTPQCLGSDPSVTPNSGSFNPRVHYQQNTSYVNAGASTYWDIPCPAGTTWSSDSNTCALDGPTDEECEALNAEPGFINSGPRSRTYDSTCLANGCKWEIVDNEQSSVVNGFVVYSGTFEFTGACTAGTNAPAADEETPSTSQTCAPASGGQTFCLMGTGEHCYTASTGKQICWRPGETGTKTTDNVAQKRISGTNPPTPPTPPDGETFDTGPSTTATTTTGGITITTTTTNFVTTGGTDAGGTDSGEPDDGTGTENEGDESGVSGGTCSAGYVCSGDAVQCAFLEEAHNSRCTREGLATDLNAAADDYGPEGLPGDAFGDGQNLAATVLDTSGWLGGGGTCPVDNLPELPGLDLVTAVCPGASVLAIYVYILGLMHCAHILGRAAAGGA